METKPQKIRLDFIAGSSFSSSTLVPDKSDKSDKSRERSASPDIRISEASGSGEEEYSCRSSASTEEELRGSDVSKEGAWKDVGEEEEEEEKEKEEKEEKEPKGKGDDDVDVAHSWKEVDHSSFLLRVGPNYQKTGTKAPSPASLYEIVGVDCIQAGNKINDIASKLTIPKDWNDIETNHPHVPSLFVVNMQIPSSFESSLFGSITDGEGWSLVYYFRIKEEVVTQLKDIESATPAVQLFVRYMTEGPSAYADSSSTWHGRFKVTLRCENMEQFGLPSFITSYNAKPVLLRNTSTFLNNLDANYAEVDVNVHQFSSLPKKALSILLSQFDQMNIAAAFCIESREDDEMPETLLGCAGIVRPSYLKAPHW